MLQSFPYFGKIKIVYEVFSVFYFVSTTLFIPLMNALGDKGKVGIHWRKNEL